MANKLWIMKDEGRYHVMETLAGQDYSIDDFDTETEAQRYINEFYADDETEGWYQIQYAHACGYYD